MSNTHSSLKLAIFDLDGTVLDTIADLSDAVCAALEKNGFPPRSPAEVMSFVGNGVLKLIERSLPEGHKDPETAALVCEDFNAHYAAHYADKTRPYAGMPELLKSLKERGVKLALLSNKPDAFTKGLAERFYPDIFDVVRGSGENTPRKPDPTAELEIIAEFSAKPDECVHVGDSDTDVMTALNAGIRCVGCTWGYRSRQTLESAGAFAVAESVFELSKFFEKNS